MRAGARAKPSRCTSRSSRAPCSRRSRRADAAEAHARARRSCCTVSHGKSAGSWNISATRRPPTSIVPERDVVEPGDEVQQRALAAARRAEEAHELALRDVEARPGRGPAATLWPSCRRSARRCAADRGGRGRTAVAAAAAMAADRRRALTAPRPRLARRREDAFSGAQVVDAVEVHRLEQADGDGVLGGLAERRGDRVDGEREVLPGALDDRGRQRLARQPLDRRRSRSRGPRAGSAFSEVDRPRRAPAAGASTSVRVLLRNSVRTIRWVVTNSPSGQRSRSSTSTLPPPSRTRRVAQGSGTQAPSISPALERLERLGVGLRQ